MKLVKTALVGVITTTSLLGAGITPAFANEVESVGESKGRVTFTRDDGGNELGPLSIDYISHFDFGTIDYHPVKGGGNYAIPEKLVNHVEFKQVPNYVQVTDYRGTNAGWSLTVMQDGEFSNGNSTLKGAEITLKNVNAMNIEGSQAPNVSEEVTITLGEGVEVAWADQVDSEDISGLSDMMGVGVSYIKFGDEKTSANSVYLDVPGGNTIEEGTNYETALTWTLHNTPQPS